MSAKLTLYKKAIYRQLKSETLPQRQKIAEQIADQARAAAPVRTGAYAGGIHTETTGTTVRVVDSDPKAIHKEYGTSDTPAHAALTNAAMKYGTYHGSQPKKR